MIRLLTVTTGLRPNLERLYPNFRIWRMADYCDYVITGIFEECVSELLSLTTWLRAILERLYRKFRPQALFDWVTTGLRPDSERLYPNLRIWRLVAYFDYATTDIFEECMPELLSLTTWLRAILERLYRKFRSQALLVWLTTRLRANLDRLFWNIRLGW